jgi:quercetin dioxygenase-like cupin family protein
VATTIETDLGCSCVLPEVGEVIRIFDEEMVVKVVGAETAGAYALIVGSVAPGGGPPLHAHPGCETAYILSGEFEITQRDAGGVSTFRAGPGTVVNAPGGVPHRFENVSPTRSTMLIVAAANTVDFLRELAAAFPPGAEPDMEKMLDIHERYAVETFHGEEGSRPEPPKGSATSARARALAWRFEQAHAALVATLEGCTPTEWRARCADTGWTVGVQAHHIAEGEGLIAGLVRDTAAGRPHPPLPPGKLDDLNARHAAAFADVTLAETVALLRANGSAAAETYRRLTDDQLALTATLEAGGPAPSVADLVEHLAIGEIERHGEAIRRAIGA